MIYQIGDSLFITPSYSNYQWYFNGYKIPGATLPYYIALQEGLYNLYVSDVYGCSVMSKNLEFTTTNVKSVKSTLQLLVYPNPVKNTFIVNLAPWWKTGSSNEINIQLCDAIGKAVISEKIRNKGDEYSISMNVSSLPAGVYVLTVSDGVASGLARIKVEK
jgi:hypothetical protein